MHPIFREKAFQGCVSDFKFVMYYWTWSEKGAWLFSGNQFQYGSVIPFQVPPVIRQKVRNFSFSTIFRQSQWTRIQRLIIWNWHLSFEYHRVSIYPTQTSIERNVRLLYYPIIDNPSLHASMFSGQIEKLICENLPFLMVGVRSLRMQTMISPQLFDEINLLFKWHILHVYHCICQYRQDGEILTFYFTVL